MSKKDLCPDGYMCTGRCDRCDCANVRKEAPQATKKVAPHVPVTEETQSGLPDKVQEFFKRKFLRGL